MIANLFLYPTSHVMITGALGGLVGAFAYLDRRIFFIESVTHGMFPGAIFGAIIAAAYGLGRLGMSTSLFVGVSLGTIPLVALMRWLTRIPGISNRGAVGVMPIAGFTSGYSLATWFKPLPLAINSFLTGPVMTVPSADVAWAGAVLLVVLVIVALSGRHLIAHCFDPANPTAVVRAGRHELIIPGLILAPVAVAIPTVSTILSIALVVAPTAALASLAHSSRAFLIGTPLLGVLLGIADLMIAAPARLSAGGTITLLCATCVLASRLPHWLADSGQKRRTCAGDE